MNIRDFEYLVALAEHKHFRKAAESCYVSQPTLSGQIKKLEEEIGLTLLERTSRKVLFTNAGLQLVDQAKRILIEVKRFSELASQQTKDMSGPLHLGFIPTVGPYLLPWIVPTLKEKFPELNLYLHEAQTSQLVKMLEEGKIDSMILASVDDTSAFIEVPIYDEPMILAVPLDHRWANEDSIDMANLSGESVLMLEDGHCLRDQALGFCFAAGAKDDGYFKSTSLETLRNMVAAGGGITLMPYLSVPKEKLRDGVCYLPVKNPVPYRKIVLAYRPGSPLRSRYVSLAKEIEKKIATVIDYYQSE